MTTNSERLEPKARALALAIERAERECAALRLLLTLADLLEGEARETIDDLMALLENTIDDRDD